jgi:hypothetical protein
VHARDPAVWRASNAGEAADLVLVVGQNSGVLFRKETKVRFKIDETLIRKQSYRRHCL